jgi:hypothetical protein
MRRLRTSSDFGILAARQIYLANFEELLPDTAAAARERKSALENLDKTYAIAERAVADSKGQSVSELANMRSARQDQAVVLEQLDQLGAAIKFQKESTEIADRIAAIQNSAANRNNQDASRARLFRLLELTGASEAEFQQHSGSSAPLTRERKQALLAEGWRLAVTAYPRDPRKGLPAAQRAVDGYRALLREGGPAQQRIDLARALNALATQYRLLSRLAPAAEQVSHLENALRASQEDFTLLDTLRTAGTLPETNQGDWSSAKIHLSAAESHLAAARGATAISNR